jgi:hypothetical protein
MIFSAPNVRVHELVFKNSLGSFGVIVQYQIPSEMQSLKCGTNI